MPITIESTATMLKAGYRTSWRMACLVCCSNKPVTGDPGQSGVAPRDLYRGWLWCSRSSGGCVIDDIVVYPERSAGIFQHVRAAARRQPIRGDEPCNLTLRLSPADPVHL